MRKTIFAISSGFKNFKLIYTKEVGFDLVGKSNARVIWCCERQKINDGLLFQAQRTWRSTQLGCQEASHSCSFFIRSRISGHSGSSSGSIVSETTSGGFRHPTETSNSIWRGQPEFYQIVTKSSHVQEEQKR